MQREERTGFKMRASKQEKKAEQETEADKTDEGKKTNKKTGGISERQMRWRYTEREVYFNRLVCIQVVAGGFSKLLHVVIISLIKGADNSRYNTSRQTTQLSTTNVSRMTTLLDHRQT